MGNPSPLIPLNTQNIRVLVIRPFSRREHSKSHVVRLKNTCQLINGHSRLDHYVSLHDLLPKLKIQEIKYIYDSGVTYNKGEHSSKEDVDNCDKHGIKMMKTVPKCLSRTVCVRG